MIWKSLIGQVLLGVILLAVVSQSSGQVSKADTISSIRGLVDTVGFCYTREQIEAVIRLSEELERDSLAAVASRLGATAKGSWIAGISPHDDHIYAGRVYVHLFRGICARHVVIFGVAHHARKWGVEDQLIFDAFDAWRGPYGPVKVSKLREQILNRLPEWAYLVSNEYQSEEHSVEGLIPFLQYYDPQARIVSILVPYMRWSRLDSLSEELAEVLAGIIKQKGWELGRDIAFLISNDCVHYGDQGWGGRDLAPFGADSTGYAKAVARDLDIAQTTLCGILTEEKVHAFYNRVLQPTDYHEYRIPWCGRFSVPFGLETLIHLMRALKRQPLRGYFLRYGTSYGFGELPLRRTGIGITAPANLHHWVGYVAIGYR